MSATCRACQTKRANRPRGLCWGCYYRPGVRERFPPTSKFAGHCYREETYDFTGRASLPATPTRAQPGSPEKVAILTQRAAQRVCLFHPWDGPDGPPPGIPTLSPSPNPDPDPEPEDAPVIPFPQPQPAPEPPAAYRNGHAPASGPLQAASAPVYMHAEPPPAPPPATGELDPLLTVTEVMALLQVCKRSICRWVASGKLPPPVRLGKNCLRWRKSAVLAWLAALPSGRPPAA